jgi:hypothetical protein
VWAYDQLREYGEEGAPKASDSPPSAQGVRADGPREAPTDSFNRARLAARYKYD